MAYRQSYRAFDLRVYTAELALVAASLLLVGGLAYDALARQPRDALVVPAVLSQPQGSKPSGDGKPSGLLGLPFERISRALDGK